VKRALLLVLGILTFLVGVAAIAGGAAVAAILGSDESLSTDPARVEGAGVALVAENIQVDESSIPVPSGVGELTLTVTAPDGRSMFAGTARPSDLDTYLTGAPYDVVVDLTSGRKASTRPVPGTQQPPPPDGQSFWLTRSSGPTATSRSALDSSTGLVVMNSDASAGVKADVVVTYRLRGAWVGAWIAVGAGVLLVLLAMLVLWRARVARRVRDAERATSDPPAAVAVSATSVLPGVDADVDVEVPAWAAASAALTGEELAGPPTGGVVVEPSPDGAAAVVSATEAPAAPLVEPDAGWYPGSVPAAAAADEPVDEQNDDRAVELGDESDDEPDDDQKSAPDDGHADTLDHDPADTQAPDSHSDDDASATAADDAVDTWQDATVPVDIVPPGERAAATAQDDPVYESLRSWFRDEAAPPASGSGHPADR
jgi:hypothetical protein